MAEGEPSPLFDRVQALTGAADTREAARIARATVSVLIEALPPGVRADLRAALPRSLRAPHGADHGHLDESLQRFYERVAVREGVAIGTAVEHAQCVCRALASSLTDDACGRLVRALPDALSPLFTRPDVEASPSPHATRRSTHAPRTLATGRAGGLEPLTEAAPTSAQAHSVARSGNPHGDTKLSSSGGATQEREQETLATGRSGSQRPLGEG